MICSDLRIQAYLPQNLLTAVGQSKEREKGERQGEREQEGDRETHFCTFRIETVQITDIIKFTITSSQSSSYSSVKSD